MSTATALSGRLRTRLAASLQAAGRRLRPSLWPTVQASAAVAIAWYLAHDGLGYPEPIFAPIAAAVSLGAARVMRGQRALQLITGVILGIGIGTGVAVVAGTGPLPLGLAALLAMWVATAIGGGFTGGGAMFINQTSVSAILVIALQLADTASARLIEALVGGGVALVIAVLLFPAAPLPLLRDAARSVFDALHAALEHLDQILAGSAPVDQASILGTGQRIYEQLGRLIAARNTATEIVRLAPRWWRARSAVRTADHRLAHVNLLAGAVLTLLRTTTGGLAVEPALPADLRAAIHRLTAALGALAEHGEAGAAEAVAEARHATGLVRRGEGRPGSHAELTASIIDTCALDICRVVGAEPDQLQ